MKQTQISFQQLAALPPQNAVPETPTLKRLSITAKKDTTHQLRDGDLVLYTRPNSTVWQMRYKLYDRVWRRTTTKQRHLEWAKKAATEIFDRARFKEEAGLPQSSRRFDTIAKECIKRMEADIANGIRPMTNKDYIRALNNYLIPFFGNRMIDNINGPIVHEYEQWRNNKMGKVPISSTLATHSSAYNKVIDLALLQGWVSEKVPIPRLSRKGRKGSARPAFNKAEIEHLLGFMPEWCEQAKKEIHRQIRRLLRDYVEILLATGMRCGKESMNMQWRHLEWHLDEKTGVKYIRIWVSGKTGGRWLIAKHIAADAFTRLAQAQGVAVGLDLAIQSRSQAEVFRTASGVRPTNLNSTFDRLMLDSKLERDLTTDRRRTLYSLRHTYATFALMDGQMDMHTLAKQMGTSVGMLEQHYSKMTATMAAERLA